MEDDYNVLYGMKQKHANNMKEQVILINTTITTIFKT